MANSSKTPQDSEDQDEKAETELLRQRAENLVRVSYQSLRHALDGQNIHAEHDETDQPDGAAPGPDGTQSNQLQLSKEDSERDNNTTEWLYDLVFSPYAESLAAPGTKATGPDDDDDEHKMNAESEAEQAVPTDAASTSKELVPAPSRRPEQMQLAVVIAKPVKVSSVVDELLGEWTNLTEEEIAGTVETGASGSKAVVPPVKFKDSVGRKFSFPFHMVQQWHVSHHNIFLATFPGVLMRSFVPYIGHGGVDQDCLSSCRRSWTPRPGRPLRPGRSQWRDHTPAGLGTHHTAGRLHHNADVAGRQDTTSAATSISSACPASPLGPYRNVGIGSDD